MNQMTTLDTRTIRTTRAARAEARLGRRWSSLRVGPTATIVGALAMVVTWLGSWNPSYRGDEAATVMSANRPIGTLLAELHVGNEVPEDIADLTAHGNQVVSSQLVQRIGVYLLHKENS
jgi:hypothetical protein